MIRKVIVAFVALLLGHGLTLSGWASGEEIKSISEFEGGKLYKVGPYNLIDIRGSYRQMGRQQGKLLKDQLAKFYEVAITNTFTRDLKLAPKMMAEVSRMIFARYPKRFQDIFFGMAETSGLELDQLLLLDQVFVLPKIAKSEVHCSGIAAWGPYTNGGALVFGRNFDYPDYFEKFNAFLTIVVYHPVDAVPTAVVGYPGQVAAMHGLNKEGLFFEINDGTVSGGTKSVDNRVSPLLWTTEYLFDSSTMEQLDAAISSSLTSIAIIVNVADKKTAASYECSTQNTRRRKSDAEGLLVETNHFVDPSWKLKQPSDEPWKTLTRRQNLLALGKKFKGRIDARKMMEIMDTRIEQGGATRPDWAVQQIVAVPAELKIWLKTLGLNGWTEIALKPLLE